MSNAVEVKDFFNYQFKVVFIENEQTRELLNQMRDYNTRLNQVAQVTSYSNKRDIRADKKCLEYYHELIEIECNSKILECYVEYRNKHNYKVREYLIENA